MSTGGSTRNFRRRPARNFKEWPDDLLLEVMEVQFSGRAVRQVHHAGGGDADGDHNRVTDLFLGETNLERFFDVAVEAPFALGHQRYTYGNQFLGPQVQRGGGVVSFLVKRFVDIAEARLDH